MTAQLGLTVLAVVLLLAGTVAEVHGRGRRLPAMTHLAAVAAMLWMLVPGVSGTAIGVAAVLLGVAVARVLVAVGRREAEATRGRTALQVAELLATALLLVVMPGHDADGTATGSAGHGHAFAAGSIASGVTIAVLTLWSATVLVAAVLRHRASRRHPAEPSRGLTSSACMVGAMSAMSVAALA
jgi:hypothetical protein